MTHGVGGVKETAPTGVDEVIVGKDESCKGQSFSCEQTRRKALLSFYSIPPQTAVTDGGGLTGCISSAPGRCTWTSGIDGRPPAPEEPSRSPWPSHRRSGSPGRRAPCPACSNIRNTTTTVMLQHIYHQRILRGGRSPKGHGAQDELFSAVRHLWVVPEDPAEETPI